MLHLIFYANTVFPQGITKNDYSFFQTTQMLSDNNPNTKESMFNQNKYKEIYLKEVSVQEINNCDIVNFSSVPVSADSSINSIFSIRIHGGIGTSRSSNSLLTGIANNIGARFLLSAGNNKSYGIEITWLNLKNSKDIIAAGFVLENKISDWFHMSIGSIGYFNFSDNGDNTAGLTTNLGWEPVGWKIKPLIALRNDFIFHNKFVTVQSLSIGLRW